MSFPRKLLSLLLVLLLLPAAALAMQDAPATCSDRPRFGPNCISKEAAMSRVVWIIRETDFRIEPPSFRLSSPVYRPIV